MFSGLSGALSWVTEQALHIDTNKPTGTLKKKKTGKEMENLQSKASKDELKSLATGNTKVFLTVWLRDSEATIALPQLTLF